MRLEAGLTAREMQYAELTAWGGSKKEVADRLGVSGRTVENTLRNIYQKIGIQKVTELAVWFFVTHYGVPLSMDPWKRKIVALFLLLLILPKEFGFEDMNDQYRRNNRARVERVIRVRNRKM